MEREGKFMIHAKLALTKSGWTENVRLAVTDGRVTQISPQSAPQPGDDRVEVLVPGMPNLHSHAFQRVMAGLAEQRGAGPESFWTWRDLMYRVALSLTPDEVEAVAAQLYVEMLEAGFTRVGEFHYLHHDVDGSPYADPAEMAARIAAAAQQTGLGLTLLPVFYAHSRFGGQPAEAGQRRFIHSLDAFATTFERCRVLIDTIPTARLGVAPHSLRAVTADQLRHLLTLSPDGPVHIHIAEQLGEVEQSLAFSGRRPVEWLYENLPVDARWCLIHATHLTAAEIETIATSGAVAGLCPITEANLGDGIFPGQAYLGHKGSLGIGSDSNILIGVADELRQLEYSQRLGERARTVLALPGQSNGTHLYEAALTGGARALAGSDGLALGEAADFVALKPRHDTGLPPRSALDRWIFANGMTVSEVWVAGRRQVSGGRHIQSGPIAQRFERAMQTIAARL